MSSDVFIVGAARTPVGSLQGTLASQTAPQLGAHAIAAALSHADINASDVDEVVMGNVVSAGLKQAPARQAMRQAKLPDSCGATTINKVCGSGLKAVMLAAQAVKCGDAALVVAGGQENMSSAPHVLDNSRDGQRMGDWQSVAIARSEGHGTFGANYCRRRRPRHTVARSGFGV